MDDPLREAFIQATDAIRVHLGDVAEELGRTRRSVQQLRAGDRGVSPEVALEVVYLLRRQSRRLLAAADELELAIREEVPDA